MEFSMKEWRIIYDKVHQLGRMLQDSHPTHDADGNYHEPKIPLGKLAQIELEIKIDAWLERNTCYLNLCDKKPAKPLWKYDRNDPQTHASSKDFKYTYLMTA